MPNLETGHYFLTVLAPVRTGFSHGVDGLSYRQTLLEVLARMPHSETTPNSRGTAQQSPFARNRMTHLARFVLIDDTPYNGRETGDTLRALYGDLPVKSFLLLSHHRPLSPSSRAFAGTHAEAWVERPLTTFHPA